MTTDPTPTTPPATARERTPPTRPTRPSWIRPLIWARIVRGDK